MIEKTILGNFSDHYNLAPIKYKWAWQALDKAFKNTWFPSEIGVGQDLHCYHKELNDQERHLFKTVFATLTTSDMCVQRNLAICVYECISAPEISAYIGWQIGQEVVHSASYQYIIEHLGLNEDEIYNLYSKTPEIRQKFDLANELSENFSLYKDAFESAEVRIKYLLKGLVFYYLCFEGGWFYNGFSPIHGLARRNKMKGAASQLQYIQRDEAGHMAFGINLIKGIMSETGVKLSQEELAEIFIKCAVSEEIYASYAIPDMVGYNAKMHSDHLKFLLDRRALAIGMEKVFFTESQLPWLDELINIKKEVNFFEGKVTEYQVGALKFEEHSKVEDILNWRG